MFQRAFGLFADPIKQVVTNTAFAVSTAVIGTVVYNSTQGIQESLSKKNLTVSPTSPVDAMQDDSENALRM